MSLGDVKVFRMREAVNLIEKSLPLKKWGFQQSTQYFDNNIHPTIIYNSKLCKIRALYEATGRRNDHLMIIDYGRLEVPDNASIVLSYMQEKDYRLLWHSVRLSLYFLDGLSPQEAKNVKHPRLIGEFEQSDFAKNIEYEPERNILLHAIIWEAYGQRLFDIFTTRSKDLWKRYSAFVKEYWKTLPQV